MKTFNWLTGTALIIIATLAGCRPSQQPTEQDKDVFKNEFTYDSEIHRIGSVVRFDQDNNTIQFWISEEEGLETVDEIERTANHLIISTHRSLIGSRDRFSKAGSFIRFGKMQYSSGDEGMGYIETDLNGDEITLTFAVEKMSTRSDEAEAVLRGEFKGTYATFTEEPLYNEWSFERKRNVLADARVIVREDGKADTYTLYDNSGNDVIEFRMPQNRRGLPTIFAIGDERSEEFNISFSNTGDIDLSMAYGSITAIPANENIKISFDITYEGNRTRAEYEGTFRIETAKTNRYIYDSGYPYGSLYDGAFLLTGLRTEKESESITFIFIPNGTEGMDTDIPELTISDLSLIGRENIDLRNTPGWYFEFDKISVGPYENEWKPAPVAGSCLTIIETEEGFYIDMELATEEPTFKYVSAIDLHYEGELSK